MSKDRKQSSTRISYGVQAERLFALPSRRQTEGSCPSPTRGGVPVEIMSRASRGLWPHCTRSKSKKSPRGYEALLPLLKRRPHSRCGGMETHVSDLPIARKVQREGFLLGAVKHCEAHDLPMPVRCAADDEKDRAILGESESSGAEKHRAEPWR